MPTRTSASDGSIPGGFCFRSGLLPQREIARIFLLVLIREYSFARPGNISGKVNLRKFAVLGKRRNAIVNRSVRLVGVVGVEQTLDQRNHFGNMSSRAGHDVRPFTTQRIEVFPQGLDVFGGVVVYCESSFLGLGDDAVFDVGDVHHVCDVVTLELQVATNNVRGYSRAEVPDVAIVPDGRATVIETDFALAHGTKLFELPGQGVSQTKHKADY